MDEVVNFDIVENDKYLLSIGKNGYGKLTDLEEFKLQGRGGKGIISYKCTDKTGEVVAAMVVSKDDEVMLITQSGIIIRIPAEQISVFGRSTQGVRLMNIKDSEVVAVAKYIGEE